MDNIIKEFVKENTENMERLISMQGYIAPLINVLARNVDAVEGDLDHICSMDIPNEFFESAKSKELLSTKVLPAMFNKISEEDGKKNILAIAMTTEVWVRKGDVKKMKDLSQKSIQELPKQEAMMCLYEFADGTTKMEVHKIHREGKMANSKGKIIDCIRLERESGFDSENPKQEGKMGGAFANMLANYLKSKKENTENVC